jgi:ParB-like chromosome segregation protein Spo0J
LDEQFNLVAGQRRLEACKELGLTKIPACVVNVDKLLAERDENMVRKDLSPSEAVAIGKAIEDREKPMAAARQAEAGKHAGRGRPIAPGNLPQANGDGGRVADKAAQAVGMSRRTYQKAKEVVEAAEEDPSLKPVVEEMDRTGNVTNAYKQVNGAGRVRRRKRRRNAGKHYAAGDELDALYQDAVALREKGQAISSIVKVLKGWDLSRRIRFCDAVDELGMWFRKQATCYRRLY